MTSFELTMPNVGSWNGKWTGEKDHHYDVRKLSKEKELELDGKYFYYNFGDGWGAGIKIKKVDAKTAAKYRKISIGFSGYEWMIDSILKNGKIITKD